ncbi:MAG: carbon storage regulator [Lachnospiraceae bacterium]|jgi:carbon storage regulator|nr:carbon storage regulator [Lachnospiraceae bacterium]MCI9389657.1 carbon storage regulator [Lachnospiraceae bacterium]MCI9470334.1 carbon storage regulator [Lachnospiraceae bacterium]
MLVLQRKKNQSLVINGNVTVSILEIGSDWIKLAIEAPKDVKILRAELMEAAEVNQEAAKELNTESVNALKNLVRKK